MKKLLVLVLSAATVFGALAISASAAFETTRTYEGQFTDVSESAWYAPSVKTCYEIGLINGASATTFNPQGMFTLAEAATIAARMHNIYGGGDGKIPAGEGAWYNGAVNYCIENGIFAKGEFSDYNRYATRAEAAGIMVAALPSSEWKAINNVTALPDVENDNSKNSKAIFTLYNAGILAGSDEYGKFQPNAAITRAELAALVVRMADADKRISVNLKPLSERKGVVLNGTFSSVTPDGKIIFSNDGKYGVMTVDGSVIIPAQYYSVKYLENGRFHLETYDPYTYKIADINGNVLYTYDGYAESLGDDYYVTGVTAVGTEAKLYCGNKVLAENFTSVVERNGDFFVLDKAISYAQSARALVDKNGKVLFQYEENQWFTITDEYIIVYKYPNYYFYDKNCNLISYGAYEKVSETTGLATFVENGKYGLASPYGKITDALYDGISLNGDFAVLRYGSMCALASLNGIIFDLGKYTEIYTDYGFAVGTRDGGVDIVDVTGDVLASADGPFGVNYKTVGNLICFGYMHYKGSDYFKNEYNFAYDTETNEVLKYVRIGTYDYNYEAYYTNGDRIILEDGTEAVELAVVNGTCVYKSLDGKYGYYWARRATPAVHDTPEAAAKGDSAKLNYSISQENGKPVVKYGDEVVIRYAKEPFYYDRITALGYNNYYICTFNNVNYIIHP
ncbi:MAG: S-layer homology domain-containing protein [Clostridia bacterium]|nr:S-layer homology domain-containing protein [Clostridia bacterium]